MSLEVVTVRKALSAHAAPKPHDPEVNSPNVCFEVRSGDGLVAVWAQSTVLSCWRKVCLQSIQPLPEYDFTLSKNL